jgi:FAD/FMN-containing dehydrogenase
MKRRAFIWSGGAALAAVSIRPTRALAGLYQVAPSDPDDLTVLAGDGREVTIPGSDLAELATRLHGRLLLAHDDGYDDARLVRNPSFDRHPALIVQVSGVADVRTAVDFARGHGNLLLAVKCGGHSFSGASTCDRGMMIDLSGLRGVRVDPTARRARVAGGSLLGPVDHETMAHGLVTPLGTVSHTGIGGLVTGGGFGRLSRRYGLSIDNLRSVDVVSADGVLRHASEGENPDLFWGVRGGGGNFGIVTSFEFDLHPMDRQVFGGAILFPIARARDALRLYGEYGPAAPDEVQLDFGMSIPREGAQVPPGGEGGMVGFQVCYSGPPNRLDQVLAPIRGLGTPLLDNVRPMDYVALQRSGDATDPRAMGLYLKTGFVPAVPDAMIDAAVAAFRGHPARGTALFTQQAGGAIARVSAGATAFSQRDAAMNLLATASWPMGADPSEHIAFVRSYWEGIEPFTHGFYVNDLEPGITARQIQENYRQNLTRLIEVKNRYDPANLFRLNANIRPTV